MTVLGNSGAAAPPPLTGRRRRAAPRPTALLSLAALLLFLLAAPCAARADEPWEDDPTQPIQMRVRVGFEPRSGFCKANHWQPVWVELKNTSEEVEGEIRILRESPAERLEETTYHRRVTLPKKSRKRFPFACLLEQGDKGLTVEFIVRRGTVCKEVPSIGLVGDEEDQVVVVSDRPNSFQVLAPPRGGIEAPWSVPRRVLTAGLETLPETWIAWSAIDALVLDEVFLDKLSALQAQAIREWVETGGTLAVCVGKLWQPVGPSPLAEFLPAEVRGSRVVRVLAAVTERYGGLLPAERAAEEAQAAELRPRGGGAETWLAALDGEHAPLVIAARRGRGRAIVCAFSPSEISFSGLSARSALLEHWLAAKDFKLLRQAWTPDSMTFPLPYPESAAADPGPIADLLPAPAAEAPAAAGGRRQAQERRAAVDDDPDGTRQLRGAANLLLDQDFLIKIPPWQLVGAFLLSYVLLLVPVNAWIFRRLDRTEWAWVSALVLTVLFALGAQRLGDIGERADLSQVAVAVLEAGPGGRVGEASAMIGLYSVGRLEEDLTFPDGETWPSRLRVLKSARGVMMETFILDAQDAPALRAFEMIPRSIRTFEATRLVPLGEGFGAEAVLGDGVVEARVANGTPLDLEDAILLLGQQGAYPIGALKAGESFRARAADRPPEKRETAVATWLRTLDARTTCRVIRTVARAAALDQGRHDDWLLLGWLPSSVVRYAVAGDRVSGAERTLVRVPLDLSFAPGRVVLGPDLWRPRLRTTTRSTFEWSPDDKLTFRTNTTEAETVLIDYRPRAWPADFRPLRLVRELTPPQEKLRWRLRTSATAARSGAAEPGWNEGLREAKLSDRADARVDAASGLIQAEFSLGESRNSYRFGEAEAATRLRLTLEGEH